MNRDVENIPHPETEIFGQAPKFFIFPKRRK
jgi:hypothetical protein